MSNLVLSPDANDWLQALADDCKALVTEGLFTARWQVIETHHQLGQRIATDEHFQKYARDAGELFRTVRELTGISESTLHRAVQFYEKWPDLALLPGGKEMSWHKVVALLPDGKQEREPSPLSKLKLILTVDLTSLSRTLREKVIIVREEVEEVYAELVKARKQ